MKWCMVPEILSATDRFFWRFGSLFALLPSKNPKNQNFEKIEKSLEILSFYTSVPKIMIMIWHVTDVIVIIHFPCPPPTKKNPNLPKKLKFQRYEKKHLKISSFYICVPKIMIVWCTVPEKWCATDRRTDGKSDT